MTATLEATAAALDDLTSTLASIEAVDAALTRLCEHAVQVIPDADAAGVTVLRDGRPVTAAHTDPGVVAVDRLRYTSNQGPCLEAAATRKIVRIDRAGIATRWPVFDAALQAQSALSVHAFLSAPLTVGVEHVGALNLYSDDTSGFDPIDAAALRIYTRAAEAQLTAASSVGNARRQINDLIAALNSRGAIEQCKAVLMIFLGIDEDRAFDLLAWRSQQRT